MIINKITLHLLSLLLTCLFDISTSFTNIPSTRTISISSSCIVKKQTHHENFFVQTSIMKRSLSMGFLEDVGNSLFGKKSEPIDPSIPTRVLEIPADIKVGGLRFTLGLILISQQNVPEKSTWKANQAGDGLLDMYFMPDQSAMFSVVITETSIAIDRYGATPSLQYMLQESLLLHTILDELETLAFGGEDDIEDENRLVRLKEPQDAINLARETLPARKA